jgi:L-ascorbate metabolism protein UlaG (beta-lactamase superfamily)
MLIFDPVGVTLPENVSPDAVVVTHEHLDHFDRRLVAEWREKLGTTVLGSEYIARCLDGKATVLQIGQSVSVGDIRLAAERCDHPGNEPLSFVIMPNDLPAIYHSGDGDPFPEMARLRRDHEPLVMLYTGASMKKAAKIAGLVRPKVILSCSCDKDWARSFAQEVKRKAPRTEARFLQPLEIWRWRTR